MTKKVGCFCLYQMFGEEVRYKLAWLIFIVLVLILVCLIGIDVALNKQVKQMKEVETAIYRLVEVTKKQNRD